MSHEPILAASQLSQSLSVLAGKIRGRGIRVCFLSHSAGLGGAEQVLVETVEAAQRAGIDCTVLVPAEGRIRRELTRIGVPSLVVSYPLWMSRDGKISIFRRIYAALGIAKNTAQVAWMLFRGKYDVVYSNTITLCVGAFAARLAGIPHVWHLQEFGKEDHDLVFLFGERACMGMLDKLTARSICVSHALAKKYIRVIQPGKVTVMYPSMQRAVRFGEEDSEAAGSSDRTAGRFRCVLVGALTEGKGHTDAVLATALLKEAGFDMELIIAGEGDQEYRARLEGLIETRGLQDRVLFVGQIKNSLGVMASADAVLMCSRSEAFGRVTVEGMLAGKAVIGARAAATEELISDGVSGLLYEPGNPCDLAAKIHYLSENPSVAQRLGENARVWARRHFTVERYREEIRDVFASILVQRNGRVAAE